MEAFDYLFLVQLAIMGILAVWWFGVKVKSLVVSFVAHSEEGKWIKGKWHEKMDSFLIALREQSSPLPLSKQTKKEQRGLPIEQWLPLVIDHDAHLFVAGPTRAGKSTLVNALIFLRAKTDKICIIDPHMNLNNWVLPVANSKGRDFDQINTIFCALEAEMTRRFRPGEKRGDAITVVIDEQPVNASETDNGADVAKKLGREAAKTGIRCIIMTQDTNVKTLGWEGEGAARLNFNIIALGKEAIKVAKQHNIPLSQLSEERPAVLITQEGVKSISLEGILSLNKEQIPLSAVWSTPKEKDLDWFPPKYGLEYTLEGDWATFRLKGVPTLFKLHKTQVNMLDHICR